ncbi:DegT/DnrJ/EryC1/StrS family aminotransferase [Candidatus Pacearchaeota archaeon]|nr:hypothetical protein [uncultured archaeon]MBS3078838.1 DegT/DnrJ/EryC1/StrS family aminotransferase [Candidatus Pacearchaeota archaeon]
MKIPWAIPNIIEEDKNFAKDIIDSGWYGMGNIVELFEKNMAKYIGVKHAIAVNNGTSAIEVLLRALNIGEGDEVIVPAYSYIATASAVNLIGAQPLFVDVDETMTINPEEIDKVITNRTKAIMCVDLTGNPCDYSKLLEKSKIYNVPLIVDGAQSLGSKYNNKSCLSYGIASTTSFHAAKILTTIEGGMIFTNDFELMKTIKKIRNQGEGENKYLHEILGGNYRMTDVAAAFGIKQLERIEKTLKKREEKVDYYKKLLNGHVKYLDVKNNYSSYFIFPVFIKDRDKLYEFLKNNGIETRKIYPRTIPKQPLYKNRENFPVAEKFCRETLSLPLYDKISFEEIEYVCNKIKEFLIKIK